MTGRRCARGRTGPAEGQGALGQVSQVAGAALDHDGQVAHALLHAHGRRALLRDDQIHLQRRLVRRPLRAP